LVTYKLVLVNTGALATSLGGTDPIAFFDVFGKLDAGSVPVPTSSNPAITCSTNGGTTPGSNVLSDCFGNLGPGESATLTVTVKAVGGSTVTGRGIADPTDKVNETNDFQPRPPDPPVTFGNNLIIKVTNVVP